MSESSHPIVRTARVVRPVVLVVAALTLQALGAAPSSARPDPGPTVAAVGHGGACLLERVGTQLVRCDDLTGNGVPAPAHVPER